ncbi:MAG: single-stranded DNA-binding protein [Alphaproteobacteria bacterium]|nr:single-stranded DNA-binding protein [Alphaproteobacteria bacterium]
MLNKVILTGNIGPAPKIWLTPDRREIATFSLATSKSWKDDLGKWQTYTDWHRVTVFRESIVKWIKRSLNKGDTVYLEGKLTYHSWKDSHNQTRQTAYIVIFGQEGRLEYLRSPQPKEQEETIKTSASSVEVENNPPSSLSLNS